jgi:hypothetical protein
MGPPSSTAPFVSKKLLEGVLPALEKLMAFEDTQAASFLLRISFYSVRATHFMRTIPITHWREVAASFDVMLRGAFEHIVRVGYLYSQRPRVFGPDPPRKTTASSCEPTSCWCLGHRCPLQAGWRCPHEAHGLSCRCSSTSWRFGLAQWSPLLVILAITPYAARRNFFSDDSGDPINALISRKRAFFRCF